MLFYHCHIRKATYDELTMYSPTLGWIDRGEHKVYLARPWRSWGETVWAYTTWDKDVIHPEGWHTGLTKGEPCPNSYEFESQDQSFGRPEWVQILVKPRLPDGTKLDPKKWVK